MNSAQFSIDDVPDEILNRIFRLTTTTDWLKHLPMVCRRFHKIVDENWRQVAKIEGWKIVMEDGAEITLDKYKKERDEFAHVSHVIKRSSYALKSLRLSIENSGQLYSSIFKCRTLSVVHLRVSDHFVETGTAISGLENLETISIEYSCFLKPKCWPTILVEYTAMWSQIFKCCKRLRHVACLCMENTRLPDTNAVDRIAMLENLEKIEWDDGYAKFRHRAKLTSFEHLQYLLEQLDFCPKLHTIRLAMALRMTNANMVAYHQAMKRLGVTKKIRSLQLGLTDESYEYFKNDENQWTDDLIAPLIYFDGLNSLLLQQQDFTKKTALTSLKTTVARLTDLFLIDNRGMDAEFFKNWSCVMPELKTVMFGNLDSNFTITLIDGLKSFYLCCTQLVGLHFDFDDRNLSGAATVQNLANLLSRLHDCVHECRSRSDADGKDLQVSITLGNDKKLRKIKREVLKRKLCSLAIDSTVNRIHFKILRSCKTL